MDAPEQTPILLGGEPGSWTPAQRSRNDRMAHFLRVLAEEGIYLTACGVSGVPHSTVHRWREDHELFAKAYDLALQQRLSAVEDNMFRIARSTDPKTANATVKAGELLLRTWNPERYTERIKNETTITVNAQVQHVHTIRDQLRERQQERLQTLRTIDQK